MQVYISSADLMTRNTERRVEIACPILDEKIRKRILDILQIQLADNVKARRLLPDKNYESVSPNGDAPLNSQEYFMKEAVKNAAGKKPTATGIWERFRQRILCLKSGKGTTGKFY